MAVLFISEFNSNAKLPSGVPEEIALQTPITEQTVAIGGASVQSAVFNTRTRLVRLHTDAVCSVSFGTNPTATATTARMGANQTEYFSVPEGKSFRVAVITNV